MELCAVCWRQIEEHDPPGVGDLLFHWTCTPGCRFCRRPYRTDEAGWDFRGATEWSDEWGYVPRVTSAACPDCSDLGQRRDYGLGT